MIGLFASVALIAIASAALSLVRGYRSNELRLIRIALAAHVFGSLALIGIYKYYYGYGDLLSYHKIGGYISTHLSTDFDAVAPRLLDLLFQQGGEELVPYGAGRSTGSMFAVAAILSFLFGDSLLASSLFISLSAFYGKLAIYAVLRSQLDRAYHKPALIGALLVPSAVFWSGSLLKESVVMSFLGMLIWGLHRLATGKSRALGAFFILVGAYGCSMFKGYLLVPSAVAAMVWLYVRRAQRTRGAGLKTIYMVLAFGGMLGLLVIIGNINPRYDVFRAETQLLQEAKSMSTSAGGSNYELLDTSGPASNLSLLATAPLALSTALLRPAIIEARNPLALVNGLETLVLTVMLIRVFRRRRFSANLDAIKKSPVLSFCVVFTILLGLGVGFATTNMGTLSRYRMPLVPFFVVVLGVLGTKDNRPMSKKQSSDLGRLGAPRVKG